MKTLILCCMLLAGSLPPVHAVVVAVFDNPTYVDTSGGPTAASDAIQALLTALGHTVVPFTGTTATDFMAAGGAADLVLFPHLLNFGALSGDLTGAATTALANYVTAGGTLIAVGDNAHTLLNAVFYPACDFMTTFCFASSGTAGPSFLDATVAAGTPFATGPLTLASPPQPGTALNFFAFTPPGGLNLYQDRIGGSPNSTTVLTAPFGTGRFGYLAWNYVDAIPLGTLDGGWSTVLDTMVQDVAGPSAIPEPSTLMLLGTGLVGLLGYSWRRRRHAQEKTGVRPEWH